MNVQVYEDSQGLAAAAAEDFAARAQKAISDTGRFTVALAGGSTPRATYEMLAQDYADSLDWSRVYVFFGDERTVPLDHADSNYRMADEALLSHVPVGGVYRMRGELPADGAADVYEEELRSFFGTISGPPAFDLVHLGIGGDGHTASLFPNTAALDVTDRWVTQNPVPKMDTTRITLTRPVLNAARAVRFLVDGEDKAEALAEILEGNADPHDYPSKFIQPSGELTWMVDRAAASQLRESFS